MLSLGSLPYDIRRSGWRYEGMSANQMGDQTGCWGEPGGIGDMGTEVLTLSIGGCQSSLNFVFNTHSWQSLWHKQVAVLGIITKY